MTTEYVDLKKGMTVEAAFEKIRKVGIDKETIYTCYVTNAKRELRGVVSAKQLMLAEPDMKIGDIALSVGFSGQQRFNDMFKKLEGITPMKYRKNIHMKNLNVEK